MARIQEIKLILLVAVCCICVAGCYYKVTENTSTELPFLQIIAISEWCYFQRNNEIAKDVNALVDSGCLRKSGEQELFHRLRHVRLNSTDFVVYLSVDENDNLQQSEAKDVVGFLDKQDASYIYGSCQNNKLQIIRRRANSEMRAK